MAPAFSQTCSTNASNVPNLCITVSPTNPPPGSPLTVIADYCSAVNNPPNGTEFVVALNSNATTIQSCPTAGQIFLVDVNGQNEDDLNPCGTGTGCDIGWYADDVNTTTPCTNHSVTWTLTVPNDVTVGGVYNVIVAAGGYTNLRCGSAPYNSISIPITIPLPPPAISAVKSVQESQSTVNPGDLLLFRMDYSFVNTSNFQITDTVPPDTTLISLGPPPTGGAVSGAGPGSPVTWTLGTATTQTTGEAWMLVRVNSGASAGVPGTVIPNTASLSSAQVPAENTNSASATVGPGFQIAKSQIPASGLLTPGQNITYVLAYSYGGQSLQLFDSYDNDAVNTSGSSIEGYDGTGYTPGAGATFGIATDNQNNHYIVANACPADAIGVTCATYATLLRNSPAVTLCGGYTVEGNLYIPNGDNQGADAHLVIADNTAAGGVGDAYMIGISLDDFPGNFFLQKNNSQTGTVTNPEVMSDAQIGTTITAGAWYTVEAQVTYSGGNLTICGKVWLTDTSEPAAFNFCYVDTSPLPCVPRNGGQYQVGWQADGSANIDYYSDLKVFGPDPAVNTTVWDTAPTGIVYEGNNTSADGASTVAFAQGPPLSWTFPGTIYNGPSGSITWWGSVDCTSTGSLINTSAIQASGPASAVFSNAVTASVATCTFSPTPTDTPTPTFTFTFTPTPSPTFTDTPTFTETPTPTFTNTFTPTPTPTDTPTPTFTFTPTPSPTPTDTWTPIFTYTPTPTPTDTFTPTATPTVTDTFTFTPTSTPTPTFTITPTPTWTSSPTATFTFTQTVTPTWTLSPTATPTWTWTSTPTSTPTVTPTDTWTLSPTDTFTFTPTVTPTWTPSPTATPTSTFTATPTATFTASPTPTATFTPSPTFTATFTPTVTPTPVSQMAIQKRTSATNVNSGQVVTFDIPLTVTGSASQSATIQDSLPTGLSFNGFGSDPAGTTTQQNGNLLTWVLPSLPVGNYDLSYQALVGSFLAGGTVLQNQAWLTALGQAPQTVSASVTVTGEFTVRIGVYNEAGELVKEILIKQYSQPIENIQIGPTTVINSLNAEAQIYYQGVYIGEWDGTTQSGQPAGNGTYFIKIDNVDLSGTVQSVTQPVVVNRVLEQVTVNIFNEAGEVIRHLYSSTSDPLGTALDQVNLSANVIDPESTTAPNQVLITANTGVTVSWDGRSDSGTVAQNGTYYIEVSVLSGTESAVITQSVVVLGNSSNDMPGKVIAMPNVLKSPGTPFLFEIDSSQNYALSVNLYDVAGELVKKFDHSPQPNQVGGPTDGLASGLYLAEVTLTDSQGLFVGRQILKVILIH